MLRVKIVLLCIWVGVLTPLVAGGSYELHEAAKEGYAGKVKELISEGASPDLRDDRDFTPLFWAIQRGHFSIVQYLLDSGANPRLLNQGDTYLYQAINLRKNRITSYLLEKNIFDEATINFVNDMNQTALTLVLERGANPTIFSLLLQKRANPHLGRLSSGLNAVCYIISTGRVQLLEEFFEQVWKEWGAEDLLGAVSAWDEVNCTE